MRVIINPKYAFLSDFIENLPKNFASNGEVIFQDRNIVKRFRVEGVDFVVKSFKKPLFINRIAYTFIRKSKAHRSYQYGLEIVKRGFDTPEPIAFLELFENGLLMESYFVSIFKDGWETVRPFMEGKVEGNQKLLAAFARNTALLHEAEILHIDYSPGNILVKENGNDEFYFSIIDINRLRFTKVDKKTAFTNLARLCTSKEVLSFIAKEYAGTRHWDEHETESQMSIYSDRYFKNYTFRLARKAWEKKKIDADINPVVVYKWYDYLSKISFLPSRFRVKAKNQKSLIYHKYLSPFDFRKVFIEKLQKN